MQNYSAQQIYMIQFSESCRNQLSPHGHMTFQVWGMEVSESFEGQSHNVLGDFFP